jgi:hypothetical protein
MVTTVSDSRLYDGQADPAVGCRAGSTSYAIVVPDELTAEQTSGNGQAPGVVDIERMLEITDVGIAIIFEN